MTTNPRNRRPSPTTIPYCLGIALEVSPHLKNHIIATFLDPLKGWMFAVRTIPVMGDTTWADGLLVTDPESITDANVRAVLYELLALTDHYEHNPSSSEPTAHQHGLPGDHPVRIRSAGRDLLSLALTGEQGQVIAETYMTQPATWKEPGTFTGTYEGIPDEEVKEAVAGLNSSMSRRSARAQANVNAFTTAFPDAQALIASIASPCAIVPKFELNGDDAGLELHVMAEAGHAGSLLCLIDRWLGSHDLPRGAGLALDDAGRTMSISLRGPALYLFFAWLRTHPPQSTT